MYNNIYIRACMKLKDFYFAAMYLKLLFINNILYNSNAIEYNLRREQKKL